jgi:hypothetical protein
MKLQFFLVIISVLSILIIAWNGMTSTIASTNYEIFTKDSTPYGIPYSEWIEKWWIWWAGIPIDKHPVKDYSDAERCSIMQDGPVWFIPGEGKINYNCTVPLDRAVLLPITTTFCEKAPRGTCGNLITDAELETSADNILTPNKNMQVMVDGVKVEVSGLPIKTGFFNLTFPENPIDIWGKVEPGMYRTIATGHFLFLHDLSPGKHQIELKVVDLLKGNEGPPPRFDPMRVGIFQIFVK